MKLTARQKDVINAKLCPYCNSGTKLLTEVEVYGRNYRNRAVITCKNFPKCDSYVGTHDDGTALGRLADKNLRTMKKRAHDAFDKLWKEDYLTRRKAYKRMGIALGIPKKYRHIGMFGVPTCIKVIKWANGEYNRLSNLANKIEQ